MSRRFLKGRPWWIILLLVVCLVVLAGATIATQASSHMQLRIPSKSSLPSSAVAAIFWTSDGQVATYTWSQLAQNAKTKHPLVSMTLAIHCKTHCPQAPVQGPLAPIQDSNGGCTLQITAWTNNNGTISGLGDFDACWGSILEGRQTLNGNTCNPVLWGCQWDSCAGYPCNSGPTKTYYNMSPSSETIWYVPSSGVWTYTPYQGLHCYGNWRYRTFNTGTLYNNDGSASGTVYEQLCGS